MASNAPPPILLRHPRERPNKCTIWPLRQRPDIIFIHYPPPAMPNLDGYVRLATDGPPLGAGDAAAGLLILDGSWRWAEAMTKMFIHVPPRSLSGFRTAYPRISKIYSDPPGGLATVEAFYVAHRILGRSTEGLLDHYHWKDAFLKANDF